VAKNKQNNDVMKVSIIGTKNEEARSRGDGQKKMCEIQVKGFDQHGKGYIFGQVAFNLSTFIDKFEKSVSVQLLKPIH